MPNVYEQTSIPVYAILADLRAQPPVPDPRGQQMILLLSITVGDNNASPYLWSASSLSADDGFYVIRSNWTPTNISGRWLRMVQNAPIVSQFSNIASADAFSVATGVSLALTTDIAITTNTTLSGSYFPDGGQFNVSNNATLIYNGKITRSTGQIFETTDGNGNTVGSVTLSNVGCIYSVWFGLDSAGNSAIQNTAYGRAMFSSIGTATGAFAFTPGITYVWTRDTSTDSGTPNPYGWLIPGAKNLAVLMDGANFDYRGTEQSAGLGTCAIGWYSNKGGTTFWQCDLEISGYGALIQPTAVGTNSDFFWFNQRGCKLTVKGFNCGQVGPVSVITPLNPALNTGHRHFLVSTRWTAAQASGVSGQRIHIEDCDWVACTSSGVIITECDALEIGVGCSSRFCGLHAIELGASAQSFNGITQAGTCSAAQVRGNHQSHVGSGVKCYRTINVTVTADFENNALGRPGLDANAVDFTGTNFYDQSLTGTTNTGNKIVNSLSGNPVTLGYAIGMLFYAPGYPAGTTISAVSSTQINVSNNCTAGAALTHFSVRGLPSGAIGDQGGKAMGCTMSNSDGTLNSTNFITFDGTSLIGNVHKGVTTSEYGIMHFGQTQPLNAQTEIFQGTLMTPFWADCQPGGVFTGAGAISAPILPGQSIGKGAAYSQCMPITGPISLDAASILITGAGVSANGAIASTLQIQIWKTDGTLITSGSGSAPGPLSSNSAWSGGAYKHTSNNGYPQRQILHFTKLTDPAHTVGDQYVIGVSNTGANDLTNLYGGVTYHICPIAPT